MVEGVHLEAEVVLRLELLGGLDVLLILLQVIVRPLLFLLCLSPPFGVSLPGKTRTCIKSG